MKTQKYTDGTRKLLATDETHVTLDGKKVLAMRVGWYQYSNIYGAITDLHSDSMEFAERSFSRGQYSWLAGSDTLLRKVYLHTEDAKLMLETVLSHFSQQDISKELVIEKDGAPEYAHAYLLIDLRKDEDGVERMRYSSQFVRDDIPDALKTDDAREAARRLNEAYEKTIWAHWLDFSEPFYSDGPEGIYLHARRNSTLERMHKWREAVKRVRYKWEEAPFKMFTMDEA